MSAALQPAGLGHNGPPSPLTPTEVREYLAENETAVTGRKDKLLAGVARFHEKHGTIDDDDTQAAAGDFVKQMQAHLKIIEEHRVEEKKPFLEGGRAVDTFFKALSDPLTSGLNTVRVKMTAYAKALEKKQREEAEKAAAEAAERARAAAEELARQQQIEAERLAAEQPAPVDPETPAITIDDAIAAAQEADRLIRQAQARPADFSRTRGEYGSVSSLREHIEIELTNIRLVPPEFLILDFAKAKRAAQQDPTLKIPGVLIKRDTGIAVR